MTTYKVGQVIYAVLRKEAKVFPLQVVEEITKRTLDGEATTYMVRAGQDPKKVVAIGELDAEVFDNAEAAQAMLIDRATQAITQRVDSAVAMAKEWYPSGFEARSEDPLALLTKQDGPAEAAPQPRRAPPPPKRRVDSLVKPEVAALAAEFAAETAASDGAYVELPDGTKARVGKIKLPAELQG